MKAKRITELNKEGKSILVALWPDDKVISCVTSELAKRCESGVCDEETFNHYINYLKEQGYEATEIELGELELEESLPKFLEERKRDIMPAVEPSAEAAEGEEEKLDE